MSNHFALEVVKVDTNLYQDTLPGFLWTDGAGAWLDGGCSEDFACPEFGSGLFINKNQNFLRSVGEWGGYRDVLEALKQMLA